MVVIGMKFCPKCGGLMYPKKVNDEIMYVCNICKYSEKAENLNTKIFISQKIKHTPKEEIIVLDSDNIQALPSDDNVICPKCGSKGAYFWQMQTRSADEPTTIFYKCKKCGHVWREY